MKKNEMSYNQKIIRSLVIKHRNDYVGWCENSYLDTGKTCFENPSIIDCEKYIYDEMIKSKEKYQITDSGNIIETKHIRFEGKTWLMELIRERIEFDYNKNGCNFPHSKEVLK